MMSSNNTNKFNPQELSREQRKGNSSSNNTNKFNPQEPEYPLNISITVQIIQINSILKNYNSNNLIYISVQIIQINSILKNSIDLSLFFISFK